MKLVCPLNAFCSPWGLSQSQGRPLFDCLNTTWGYKTYKKKALNLLLVIALSLWPPNFWLSHSPPPNDSRKAATAAFSDGDAAGEPKGMSRNASEAFFSVALRRPWPSPICCTGGAHRLGAWGVHRPLQTLCKCEGPSGEHRQVLGPVWESVGLSRSQKWVKQRLGKQLCGPWRRKTQMGLNASREGKLGPRVILQTSPSQKNPK